MQRQVMEDKTTKFADALMNGWRKCVGDIPDDVDMNSVTDATEDFTAMLVAMHFIYETMTGDEDEDLIGFTHMLNRLAVQFTMEICDWGDCEDCDE